MSSAEILRALTKRLLRADSVAHRSFRWLLVAIFLVLSIKTLIDLQESFRVPHLYRKDFIQDYLLGTAYRLGQSPYQRIDVLENNFLGLASEPIFPHPSPHPPSLLPIWELVSHLGYRNAAILMACAQLLLLVVLCGIYVKALSGRPSAGWVIFSLLVALSSYPFYQDLITGQVNLFLAVCCLVFIWGQKTNKQVVSGFALGLAASIKLFGLPLGLWLLIKRRWKAALVSALVFLTMLIVPEVRSPHPLISSYFTEAVPEVRQLYMTSSHNQSIMTLPTRIFLGLDSSALSGVTAAPLYQAPMIANVASPLLTLIFIAAALWRSWQSRSLDLALSLLFICTTITAPVVWPHSIVVLLVPFAICHRAIAQSSYPTLTTGLFVATGVALYLGGISPLIAAFEHGSYGFWMGMMTFLPGAAILALFCLNWALIGANDRQA